MQSDPSTQPSPQMEVLGSLLQIEHDVRQAPSESAVEFIAVNDTWRLMHYRQAALWRTEEGGRPAVRLLSGLADLQSDSPYRQWLNQAIGHVVADLTAGQARLITVEALPEALKEGWREWMPPAVVVIVLPSPDGSMIGGIWFAVEEAPQDSEMALIERLSWAYGQALWAWRPHEPVWRKWLADIKQNKFNKKRYWLAILVVLLLPMRLTALAPAEVIGKDAKQVGAPMDGVVADFFVKPNQKVQAGDPVFSLDDTSVRNRNEVADRSRAVAQAEYLREMQKSFSDGGSRADLSSYKARFEEKQAEARFAKDLLGRIRIMAPVEGVVVFSDENDWVGKPVQTGERIVQIADPRQVQVSIDLPVDDAINIDLGAKVKLYLNISPLDTMEAELTQSSYEPTLVPEGFVAYRLKADLLPGETIPRIGMKGTVKIYGAWAPFIYHVLRKPLSVVRRYLGI